MEVGMVLLRPGVKYRSIKKSLKICSVSPYCRKNVNIIRLSHKKVRYLQP